MSPFISPAAYIKTAFRHIYHLYAEDFYTAYFRIDIITNSVCAVFPSQLYSRRRKRTGSVSASVKENAFTVIWSMKLNITSRRAGTVIAFSCVQRGMMPSPIAFLILHKKPSCIPIFDIVAVKVISPPRVIPADVKLHHNVTGSGIQLS